MKKENDIIIMYPKEELETIVIQLKDIGFIESEKPRINIGDKLIVNLKYEGKEKFSDAINKIKEIGINYEIPSLYQTYKKNNSNEYNNLL
jgi:hypothetical protein